MTRARSQAGFTLVELLVAMLIGMLTILAAFALIDATTTGTARVTARTDASQRGRVALDRMTRSLRSQVCVYRTAPISVGTANQVTFTADLSSTGNSDKRQLTFDPTAKTITLGVAAGSGVEGMTPGRVFASTFATQVLLNDVVADGTTPVFSYWADVPGTGGSQQTQLSAPLAAADLARVARIDITFVARPTRASTTENWSSAFQDSVVLRAVDANNANPTFTCP